jgi:hypothetical protein
MDHFTVGLLAPKLNCILNQPAKAAAAKEKKRLFFF